MTLISRNGVKIYEQIGVVARQIAIDTGGLGFDFLAGQIGQGVTMLLRSCVAQALNRGDGPRHWLHALAQ